MRVLIPTITLIFLCVTGTLGQAASPSPTPSSSVSLQDYRDILESERKLLDDQSERYYARIDTLINRSLWVFGIILSGAAGLFLWQYGKTKSEMKTVVKEQFQEQAASLIDKEMIVLRSQVQSLEKQVQELQAAYAQQILWIFSGTETASNQERESLIQRGIRNITLLTPAVNADFDLGDPALVILSYDRSGEALRRLARVAEILKDKERPISLIIYTYDPSAAEFRLGEPERRVLGDFLWYLPANYPATLIAQTQMLLRESRPT